MHFSHFFSSLLPFEIFFNFLYLQQQHCTSVSLDRTLFYYYYYFVALVNASEHLSFVWKCKKYKKEEREGEKVQQWLQCYVAQAWKTTWINCQQWKGKEGKTFSLHEWFSSARKLFSLFYTFFFFFCLLPIIKNFFLFILGSFFPLIYRNKKKSFSLLFSEFSR